MGPVNVRLLDVQGVAGRGVGVGQHTRTLAHGLQGEQQHARKQHVSVAHLELALEGARVPVCPAVCAGHTNDKP